MHRPVLVTAPAALPVSLEEMKQALRIIERDGDDAMLPHDDDDLIEDEIRSAVSHYEGWTGILGIALSEQVWRQDFDRFGRCLPLALGPAIATVAVRWRNRAGQIATVNQAEYAFVTDAGGASFIRFRNSYSFPGDLYERGAVQVEYRAGWPVMDGKSTVPPDIRTAIKFRVQMAYDEAARAGADNLEKLESGLIAKWGRMRL